jgi:serine/threonine protein kinase
MSAQPPALAPGFQVDTLRVDRVLGRGAFGITYLVTDTVLYKPFALKEYLPEALAIRTGDGRVETPTSSRYSGVSRPTVPLTC